MTTACAIAVPFLSDSAPSYDESDDKTGVRPTGLVAAAQAAVAAGAEVEFSLTAPVEGWMNLAGIVASLGATAVGAVNKSLDLLGAAGITSLLLPGNQQLVYGTSSPICPARAFDPRRSFDWFDLGWLHMNQSATVKIKIKNLSPVAGSGSFGAPFVAADPAYVPDIAGMACGC
jgi:hypothetical protein